MISEIENCRNEKNLRLKQVACHRNKLASDNNRKVNFMITKNIIYYVNQ